MPSVAGRWIAAGVAVTLSMLLGAASGAWMNRYLKAVLVWVVWPALAVGVTTVATAAATAAAAATLPPDMAGQIDSLVEATLQRKHAPGAVVAIVSDGAVVLRKAYGQADLDPQRPMRIDSRFEIGSITKQLTAAAILRLCASGKLSLDDTLRHHVLGYAAGS
jgi:CubicO group peptidase (beta-lactamase class C family)